MCQLMSFPLPPEMLISNVLEQEPTPLKKTAFPISNAQLTAQLTGANVLQAFISIGKPRSVIGQIMSNARSALNFWPKPVWEVAFLRTLIIANPCIGV